MSLKLKDVFKIFKGVKESMYILLKARLLQVSKTDKPNVDLKQLL